MIETAPVPSEQTAGSERNDTPAQMDLIRQRRRLRAGGALLILAGVVSLMMMVAGFSSMNAENGTVEYFEVWLPPWFLLGEIMLFTSMAIFSIVTGALVQDGRDHGSWTLGALCSLVGFGFMFGLPGLILVIRARRSISASPGRSL